MGSTYPNGTDQETPGFVEPGLSTHYTRFTNFKYLGCFSTKDGVNYIDAIDGENMSNVVNLHRLRQMERPMSINLREGFDRSAVSSSYTDVRKHKYRHFIEWLQEREYIPKASSDAVKTSAPDFVVTNGAMQKLMTYAYKKEYRPVYAMKQDGIIYLSSVPSYDFDVDDKSVDLANTSEERKRKQFTHLKFVSFVLDTEEISDTNKFYSVYEFMFRSKRMIIMSEVRAMLAMSPSGEPQFVEIKSVTETAARRSNKKKLSKFLEQNYSQLWLQCTLANKQKLINGLRSDDILENVEILSMEQVQDRSHTKESIYFNFLDEVLNMFVDNVSENGSHVYEFRKLTGVAKLRPFFGDGKCFLPNCKKGH